MMNENTMRVHFRQRIFQGLKILHNILGVKLLVGFSSQRKLRPSLSFRFAAMILVIFELIFCIFWKNSNLWFQLFSKQFFTTHNSSMSYLQSFILNCYIYIYYMFCIYGESCTIWVDIYVILFDIYVIYYMIYI